MFKKFITFSFLISIFVWLFFSPHENKKINIVNNIIRDKSDIGYLVIASNNKGESPGELVEFISKSGFSIPVVVIPGDISNDNIDELVGIK